MKVLIPRKCSIPVKVDGAKTNSLNSSTNKTLNPYNFCRQKPNMTCFGALESPLICEQESFHTSLSDNSIYAQHCRVTV